MSAALSPESVQLAVLAALDSSSTGTIDDSRTLIVEGRSMDGPAEQTLIKAAVDSLDRKEVRPPHHTTLYQTDPREREMDFLRRAGRTERAHLSFLARSVCRSCVGAVDGQVLPEQHVDQRAYL